MELIEKQVNKISHKSQVHLFLNKNHFYNYLLTAITWGFTCHVVALQFSKLFTRYKQRGVLCHPRFMIRILPEKNMQWNVVLRAPGFKLWRCLTINMHLPNHCGKRLVIINAVYQYPRQTVSALNLACTAGTERAFSVVQCCQAGCREPVLLFLNRQHVHG